MSVLRGAMSKLRALIERAIEEIETMYNAFFPSDAGKSGKRDFFCAQEFETDIRVPDKTLRKSGLFL